MTTPISCQDGTTLILFIELGYELKLSLVIKYASYESSSVELLLSSFVVDGFEVLHAKEIAVFFNCSMKLL